MFFARRPNLPLRELILSYVLVSTHVARFIEVFQSQLIFRQTRFTRTFRGNIAIILATLALTASLALASALGANRDAVATVGSPLLRGSAACLATLAACFGGKFTILREAAAFGRHRLAPFAASLGG